PTERIRVGGRATPESLRELVALLASLIRPTPDPAACPCMASTGEEPHEQATASIRSPHASMGARTLESHRCAETPGDSPHSGEHCQSFTDSTGCDENQGG